MILVSDYHVSQEVTSARETILRLAALGVFNVRAKLIVNHLSGHENAWIEHLQENDQLADYIGQLFEGFDEVREVFFD